MNPVDIKEEYYVFTDIDQRELSCGISDIFGVLYLSEASEPDSIYVIQRARG